MPPDRDADKLRPDTNETAYRTVEASLPGRTEGKRGPQSFRLWNSQTDQAPPTPLP